MTGAAIYCGLKFATYDASKDWDLFGEGPPENYGNSVVALMCRPVQGIVVRIIQSLFLVGDSSRRRLGSRES